MGLAEGVATDAVRGILFPFGVALLPLSTAIGAWLNRWLPGIVFLAFGFLAVIGEFILLGYDKIGPLSAETLEQVGFILLVTMWVSLPAAIGLTLGTGLRRIANRLARSS